MFPRFSTELRFMSALDEHAGHSSLASVTQLQSRQRTVWTSGITDVLIIVFMAVFIPILRVAACRRSCEKTPA